MVDAIHKARVLLSPAVLDNDEPMPLEDAPAGGRKLQKGCYQKAEKFRVLATEPFKVALEPKTRMFVGSASAFRWSHDPLAGLEAAIVDPSQGGYQVRIDRNTIKDIVDIAKANPECLHSGACVKKDVLDKVVEKIRRQVELARAFKRNILIVKCFELDGDEKWVAAEIWKKYIYRRLAEKDRLAKSFVGACGEKNPDGTPNLASVKDAGSVFLGRYPGEGTLPVGALIATAGTDGPVLFCEYGNTITNPGNNAVQVTIQINDDQPADNSGWVELTIFKQAADCR